MSAPFAVTGVTPDKPSYNRGDLITVTVQGTFAEPVTISASLGGETAGSGTIEVSDPLTVSDTDGRPYAQQSNNGTTAVFTATA